MKEHDQAFADLAASIMIFASVGLGSDATRGAELVTGDYFQALGVGAQLGRTLQPSDDVAQGQHPVAVIAMVCAALRRRSHVIGKTLYLNGQPLTIVGVADPDPRHRRQHGRGRVRPDHDAAAWSSLPRDSISATRDADDGRTS